MNKKGKKILRSFICFCVTVFLFSSLTLTASGDVPKLLSFQGRLTNSSGSLLGGSGTNYYFKFAIYDSLASGTKLWPSGAPPSITSKVTQGVFNVLIGDTSLGFSALDLNFDSGNYYLEVQASEDNSSFETLSPRQRIGASGFAVNAETVHGGRFINATGVGQFGSLTTVSYSRFGTDTTTHSLSAASDLLVSGILEANSQVFFDANASLSGNFELTSSGSKLGINAGGLIDTTFEVGGTASFSSAVTLGSTLSVTGNALFSSSASVSSNFETVGYASASAFKGLAFAGMTGTDGCSGGTADKILYTASTGKFSCGTDQTGGGGGSQIEIGASNPNSGLKVSSVSFDAGHFNVADGGGYAIIRLDWDSAGGPASLSQNETVSGDWIFSNNASVSNILEAATIKATSLTNSTGTLTIAAFTLSGAITGADQDINDLNNLQANTLEDGEDAVLTVNDTLSIVGGASVSTIFEVGSNASIGGNLNVRGTGSSSFAASLNVTTGFTANAYQGAGLTICNGTTQKLTYNAGQFACGTDGGVSNLNDGLDIANSGGTYFAIASLQFDASHFTFTNTASSGYVRLDWGAGGPASLSEAETIAGDWVNTTNPWADNEVSDDLTIVSTTNTSSNSFAGSLNVTKSITTVKTLTAAGIYNSVNYVGTGVGSSSFAGSLDITKGLTANGSFTIPNSLYWTATRASSSINFEAPLIKVASVASDASLTLRPGTDTANAVKIQNAAGSSTIIRVSTSSVGAAGSEVVFSNASNAGIRFAGDARNRKRFTLWPEFAGAVMTGNATNSSGTMTSDNESSVSFRSYYQWSATSTTTQEYKIYVKIPVPADFSAFYASSGFVVGGFKSTAASRIMLTIRNSANSADARVASSSIATTIGSWTMAGVSPVSSGMTAGYDMTLIFEMLASSSSKVRLGSISFEYLSTF